MVDKTKVAWDCKSVFVNCAFELKEGQIDKVLPAIFEHLSQQHYNMGGHADPSVTLNNGVTYS